MKFIAMMGAAVMAAPGLAAAQDSDADLAKKLANPVADLVSLPFQFNYDCCYGPADGERVTLNIQPVVPIHLTEDWNLIVRTIVPIVSQTQTTPTGGDALGFGDTLQTFFFSPKTQGTTVGFGPAVFYPTGTDGLGSGQWAAGPAGLVLKQDGHMTYGVLATQLWSLSDAESNEETNSTLLQPFFNYTFPSTTGIVLNLESTYDWTREQWTVPLNVGVTHMYKLGEQRIQAGIFGRYYVEKPDGGPDWGLRFVVTYLIPS